MVMLLLTGPIQPELFLLFNQQSEIKFSSASLLPIRYKKQSPTEHFTPSVNLNVEVWKSSSVTLDSHISSTRLS